MKDFIIINNKKYTLGHLETIFHYLEKEPDALGRCVEGIMLSDSRNIKGGE